MNTKESLPVMEHLDGLLSALGKDQTVILKAPPGAGKTTMVPPAILDSGVHGKNQILVVQPRRLAAIATAQRIAELRGTPLGDQIGYHVRFDSRYSPKTELLTLTTGLLLRRLIRDPLLETVGCVILDEFHERSIEMDLALGMIQQIRTAFRPELKLVIMSATLDAGPLTEFIKDSVSIQSSGRTHPVKIQYEQDLNRDPIEDRITSSLDQLLIETQGHILIFLPGVGEIRRVKHHLQDWSKRIPDNTRLEFHELYGTLSPKKQQLALKRSDHRKIILSTNIAETSITIPGVESVIDTGVARVLNHDTGTGLPRLDLQPISQASAEQRSGRAGRTAPGTCHRLWPQALQKSRRKSDLPEILRGDLSSVILTLAHWGERDITAFPWLTAPPTHAVEHAIRLLQQLKAMDSKGGITELGRQMVKLPLTPRLARLMIDASERGIIVEASISAALLSERDPFTDNNFNSHLISSGKSHGSSQRLDSQVFSSHSQTDERFQLEQEKTHASIRQCDLWPRVQAIQAIDKGMPAHQLDPVVAKQVLRVARQLQQEVSHLASAKASDSLPEPANKTLRNPLEDTQQSHTHKATPQNLAHPAIRLRETLLGAFPDRLAKKRSQDPLNRNTRAKQKSGGTSGSHPVRREQRPQASGTRGVMANGKGVQLLPSSHVNESDLFLCLDMQASGAEAKVRLATGLKREWLDKADLRESELLQFDKDKLAITARRQLSIHGLVLQEIPIACNPNPEVAKLLLDAAMADLSRVIPADDHAVSSFATRIKLIRDAFPDIDLAEVNHETFRGILTQLCQQCASLKELANADWHSHLKNRYEYSQLIEMDRLTPLNLQIPSGRSVPITYLDKKPPKIEVRIQEIFGWRDTPRILNGKLPIQLHLLGPNGRPQQITDDLRNFWATTYQSIKKELKRRYPKHAWPEDPLTETATKSGLRRRT